MATFAYLYRSIVSFGWLANNRLWRLVDLRRLLDHLNNVDKWLLLKLKSSILSSAQRFHPWLHRRTRWLRIYQVADGCLFYSAIDSNLVSTSWKESDSHWPNMADGLWLVRFCIGWTRFHLTNLFISFYKVPLLIGFWKDSRLNDFTIYHSFAENLVEIERIFFLIIQWDNLENTRPFFAKLLT